MYAPTSNSFSGDENQHGINNDWHGFDTGNDIGGVPATTCDNRYTAPTTDIYGHLPCPVLVEGFGGVLDPPHVGSSLPNEETAFTPVPVLDPLARIENSQVNHFNCGESLEANNIDHPVELSPLYVNCATNLMKC